MKRNAFLAWALSVLMLLSALSVGVVCSAAEVTSTGLVYEI